MSDGAHQGVKADRALETILGGKDSPSEQEQTSADQVYARLKAVDLLTAARTYEGTADAWARIVLDMYEQYPMLRDLPTDREFLKNKDGEVDWSKPIAINLALADIINQLFDDEKSYERQIYGELTGFQFGFGVNAARFALGLGPVPNPAIVTVGE